MFFFLYQRHILFKIKTNGLVKEIKEAYENQKATSFQKLITKANFNEKCVELNLTIERNKASFDGVIEDEYIEKTILYGYMILFSNVFSLAPLIVLINLLCNLRATARSYIWYYRRPIGYKAQSIGGWLNICRFLNLTGIINLSKIKFYLVF